MISKCLNTQTTTNLFSHLYFTVRQYVISIYFFRTLLPECSSCSHSSAHQPSATASPPPPPTNVVIFALHAYKSSAAVRLLFDSPLLRICRFVIILGGTDINEMSETMRPDVEATLNLADSIISFTQCLANAMLEKVSNPSLCSLNFIKIIDC